VTIKVFKDTIDKTFENIGWPKLLAGSIPTFGGVIAVILYGIFGAVCQSNNTLPPTECSIVAVLYAFMVLFYSAWMLMPFKWCANRYFTFQMLDLIEEAFKEKQLDPMEYSRNIENAVDKLKDSLATMTAIQLAFAAVVCTLLFEGVGGEHIVQFFSALK
jgi:hypothetical protein